MVPGSRSSRRIQPIASSIPLPLIEPRSGTSVFLGKLAARRSLRFVPPRRPFRGGTVSSALSTGVRRGSGAKPHPKRLQQGGQGQDSGERLCCGARGTARYVDHSLTMRPNRRPALIFVALLFATGPGYWESVSSRDVAQHGLPVSNVECRRGQPSASRLGSRSRGSIGTPGTRAGRRRSRSE